MMPLDQLPVSDLPERRAFTEARDAQRLLQVGKSHGRAQWVQSMIMVSGPSFFSTAALMAAKCGQG